MKVLVAGATGFVGRHVVAAFLAGAFWGAMVARTRSAVPALVCHLLWDVAVLYLAPYGGA